MIRCVIQRVCEWVAGSGLAKERWKAGCHSSRNGRRVGGYADGQMDRQMMGTIREAAESGGDETGDETGGPGNETGDKTAATAGDERDGGDRWGNVYGRRRVRI